MSGSEWELLLNVLQAVGAVGTAVGVFFAWRTLHQSEKQALTQFEDEFPREYRELLEDLPVEAVLGKELQPSEQVEAKSAFFRYLDLCNEEVFLRQNGRVSKPTWLNWCGGIQSNLRLPAFKDAWREVKKAGLFAELSKLEESGFKDDPKDWGTEHIERTRSDALVWPNGYALPSPAASDAPNKSISARASNACSDRLVIKQGRNIK